MLGFTNPQGFGIAWADISTGEFNVYEYVGDNSLDRLSNLLGSISPSEIICNDDFVGKYQKVQYFVSSDKRARCYHDFAYSLSAATKRICSSFKITSLSVFELDDKKTPYAQRADFSNTLRKRKSVRSDNSEKSRSYMTNRS